MRLPNANVAVVEREKITEYLLNVEHRHGASKARFFAEFGFRLQKWETLADSLREHGRAYEVARTRQTFWGPRFELDGELTVPDGRAPRVCTGWQLDDGEIAPRLITAYPLEIEKND